MDKPALTKNAQTREVLLFVLTFFLLLFVFFRYVYTPLSGKIGGVGERLKTIAFEQKALKGQIETLRQQDVKKRSTLKIGENVKLAILKGERGAGIRDIHTLIQTISSPRFQYGLVIHTLSIKPTESRNGHLATPFQLVTRGSFDQIISFIAKLDNLPALVLVDSIDLSMDREHDNEINLEVSASFYQMEGFRGSP